MASRSLPEHAERRDTWVGVERLEERFRGGCPTAQVVKSEVNLPPGRKPATTR